MSPEQQRKVAEMDFKNTTLGFIFDQYTHPVSFWESGAYKDFSKTWAHIKKGIATWFNVRQAQSALKTNIPGGTGDRTALAEELAEIYLRVHKAQAQMQPDLARDVSWDWVVCGERVGVGSWWVVVLATECSSVSGTTRVLPGWRRSCPLLVASI